MLSPVTALTQNTPAKELSGVFENIQPRTNRYGFTIGSLNFLLPQQKKVEIIDAYAPSPIPNTPLWFAGIISLRGNLLPVFNLKILFNMEEQLTGKWIMIFGKGSRTAGIFIDSLPSARNITPVNEIDEELPPLVKDHTTNIYNESGEFWLETEFDNIFSDIHKFF